MTAACTVIVDDRSRGFDMTATRAVIVDKHREVIAGTAAHCGDWT